MWCENTRCPNKELVLLEVRRTLNINFELFRCKGLFDPSKLIDITQLPICAIHIKLELVESVILEYKRVPISNVTTPTLDSFLAVE